MFLWWGLSSTHLLLLIGSTFPALSEHFLHQLSITRQQKNCLVSVWHRHIHIKTKHHYYLYVQTSSSFPKSKSWESWLPDPTHWVLEEENLHVGRPMFSDPLKIFCDPKNLTVSLEHWIMHKFVSPWIWISFTSTVHSPMRSSSHCKCKSSPIKRAPPPSDFKVVSWFTNPVDSEMRTGLMGWFWQL